MRLVLKIVMKDKSKESPVRLVLHKHDERQIGEFPVRLVLHKHDERQIRRFLIEISPSSGLREKNQHLSLTKPL